MFGKRTDGTRCTDVPPYRRIMPYIMKGRNESVFYLQQEVDLDRVEAFLASFNAAHPETKASLFHVVCWAAVRTLTDRPRMNRFVVGGKLWQRNDVTISYAAKKKMDDDHPITTLKRTFDPSESFEQMLRGMYGELKVGRSDEESHVDKELDLFLKLPGPILRLGVKAIRGLDAIGALPRSFTEPDPMYCSLFVANLGSLKMDGGFHHLYEYGTCPIFCVVGRTKEVPAVVDGAIVARRVATLRWSYDERVEDGLYAQRCLEEIRGLVEDPAAHGAWTPDDAAAVTDPHSPVAPVHGDSV